MKIFCLLLINRDHLRRFIACRIIYRSCIKENFVITQLDTKTVYSFMDSLVSIKKYVQRSKDLGYKSLGMMDVDNLYGAYHFLEEAKAAGLQPLLGLEMEILKDGNLLNLRLLALDSQGYRNLMKISTLKMMNRQNWEDFQHLFKGLALIVPIFEGVDQLDLGLDFYVVVFPDTPR